MKRKKNDIEQILGIRYLRHILFWVGYVLTMTYIHGLGIQKGEYLPWLMNYIIELPVLIGLTYIITYFVIPKYLLRRKYFLTVLLVISGFVSFSFINILLDDHIINPYFLQNRRNGNFYEPERILSNAFGLMFPVVIFVAISFSRFSESKSRNDYLQERSLLKAQLDRIRNSMYPVFLRDALDDIYVMSRNNSGVLPEMILKISDILHYFLHECGDEKIPLRKEEQSLRTFMGFKKLRFGENFNSDIYISGELGSVAIAPFILIPLVRSIYRFNNDYDQFPGKLFIRFHIQDKMLNFSVSQKISPEILHNNIDFEWKDDIAIARRQLELIYSWKYKLDIVETELKLVANLSLDLS